ncbi:Cell envelope-related transcriptional attenuator [[Clostridium] ultunense Esp]|uniref:Cell envelope-related transcriptional attenuator n=1 Tax=[Clostridium] ultunense Esp TaxID=1288971 RepID=M1ZLK2_9FIRM|nr:LCP family protein [Schnuerera ultunensis]CCQ97347.1 Cell envelope-related transcriptional attenuator [[Clostridium] ultunense Esp]SHD78408.1 Cell envelope-related transcriptional attenuator [[Clostridium] ultunense Esp]
MKTFWKVFIVSFIFFFVAIFLGSYSYLKSNEYRLGSNISSKESRIDEESSIEKTTPTIRSYSSLAEAFKDSNRINLILLGMEDIRTDTIIFATFNPKSKQVNTISIPRDTYIHRRGYNQGEQRKINAIYGDHGVEGVKKAVSHILEGVPIHHYIMIDYEGVENIIDSIGGVEVMVPFHMKYEDPTADPPLNIDIKEGKQVLNGKKSLDFLRYRKGNNNQGGYIDGDLGRIKAQQQFLQSFTDKVLTYRLPIVIKKGFDHINTDIKLFEGLAYSRKALGIKRDDFTFITLPGKPELKKVNGKILSYFIFEPSEINKVLEEIYNVK